MEWKVIHSIDSAFSEENSLLVKHMPMLFWRLLLEVMNNMDHMQSLVFHACIMYYDAHGDKDQTGHL